MLKCVNMWCIFHKQDLFKPEELFWFFELTLGLITKENIDVSMHNWGICSAASLAILEPRIFSSLCITKRVAMKTGITYSFRVNYLNTYVMSNTFPIKMFFVHSFMGMHSIIL